MTRGQKAGKLELWFVLALSLCSLVALTLDVSGVPQGATVISNSTEGTPSTPAGSRADDGGSINIITLDSTQQNAGWKAYVGNVSGRLTLDDSSGNTIYDWSLPASSISGEVYVSRNDSVVWSNVSCANQTIINTEDSFFSKVISDSDSINSTFNWTNHLAMQVGVNSILADTCRGTATYVNDTFQPVDNSTTVFQEILLQDQNSALVYATFISQDQSAYKIDNTTYDFQLLVGEDSGGGPTTYYFYLEIGA